MDSILITGGAGFIGSNFVRIAVEEFDDVYVLDKFTYAANEQNLVDVRDEIQLYTGDIGDREVLDSIYPRVDGVVNMAAESHVDRSIQAGATFVQSNTRGAFVAMDALRDHDVDRFVQVSTDEVYGSTTTGTFDEDAPLNPSSPYSASKASADLFVKACWKTYDLPITIVRPTNVFGPRQHPEKLIPKFVLRALAGESLPLYGDGTNERQWLYVDDLSECLLAVLRGGSSSIYNLAGPEHRSNIDVARAILDHLDRSHDLIEFVEDRMGHDQRYALSDEKFRSEFGIVPQTGFNEGLGRTISWYESMQDRYDGPPAR